MFSDLVFDEQRHLYFVNNVNYPSVSSKINNHSEKFEESKWLPVCAIKEGVTQEELRNRWHTHNKEARERGTATHDYLENFETFRRANTAQKKAGSSFLKKLYSGKRFIILFRELRMYHKKFKFAGTADLILWDTLTNSLVIVDYKTNADLFKTFKYLKPPFNYLENNPYNKYQLQLSYYKLMLEQVGINVSVTLIIHLRLDESYIPYETVDLTKQLLDYLNGVTTTSQINWCKVTI